MIKIIQLLTTPLVTFAGIALALPLILLLAIGLLLAMLKEIINYFSRSMVTDREEQVFISQEQTITIIPIPKKPMKTFTHFILLAMTHLSLAQGNYLNQKNQNDPLFTERGKVNMGLQIQKVLYLVLVVLFLPSCVSYKSITLAEPSANQLKPSSGLASGDVVKIIMNSGEAIEKMKVKGIDSSKISGIQVKETSPQWTHVNRTILIHDIKEIKKRKFSAEKTAGVIGLSIGVPLLLMATTYHPTMSMNWGP